MGPHVVEPIGSGGETVLAGLRALPGGPQLLELASAREDVELVGGATRDLLLARLPRELDVVVADGAGRLAGDLFSALAAAGEAPEHSVNDRFGTACVSWECGRIDLATRRAESYAYPGALPDVRAGTPEQDLARRDFTVNAIAAPLGDVGHRALRAADGALEDLQQSRLRVLHERSFLDDPTRILRLARYSARLSFQAEKRTAELAREALAKGALQTVSGARIGAELRLALAEPDALVALSSLQELGVLSALEQPLGLEQALAHRSLELLPETDGRTDLLLLACLLSSARVEGEDRAHRLRGFLDRLEFTATDRERALAAALIAPSLAEQLGRSPSPSQLRELLSGVAPEAIALAAALGDTPAPHGAAAAAGRWLGELRHVRLQITGDDLIAAGIPAGPEIGRRLAAALDMRLDGRLDDTREAQLQAALEASV